MNTMPQPEYPVYCAWCIPKGKQTIIRYEEVKDSHGICPECYAVILKEMEDE